MAVAPKLFCPIRGSLNIAAKAKDGLTFTEEKRRIECITYLLDHGYSRDNIRVEKTIILLGHKGKNSLKADLVVYNRPCAEVLHLPLDQQREYIFLVAEVKRDHKDAQSAIEQQLKPALNLLPNIKSIGIYWDDVEQRLFYKQLIGTSIRVHDAPIAFLPPIDSQIQKDSLRYSDLTPSNDLIGLFAKIENSLHSYIADKSARFELLMQLILVKMFDEKASKRLNLPLGVQDFSILNLSDEQVLNHFNDLLKKALNSYQIYLPDKISDKFDIPGSALREVSKHIAPVNMLNADPDVMQNFYMYFAKQLYKWDLAQYFTPYEVVDFIVRIINPQYGEIIKDPACGSADFLTSAFKNLSKVDDRAGDRVFGADNSKQAVQISVLNMLLNDDGKSNIKEEDSLLEIDKDRDRYNIMLCNPPFGVRIQERRERVLRKFDLGRDKESQEVGILFTELCVRQAKPEGGRIAIILPNGYLGNRSERYAEFRRWLLRHARVVAIIAFPRFTFKKSGADVSASAVFLERRAKPLLNPSETEDYPVYVNYLESVGWNIGNKKAQKIYKRDPLSGAVILNEKNEPILDADFDEVEIDLLNSATANQFRWLTSGKNIFPEGTGWSISIRHIVTDPELSLDPKRLNRKYFNTVSEIKAREHVSLAAICDVLPEGFVRQRSVKYRYVELQDIHERSYEFTELYGWQLPSRAKHLAEPGDIFVGKIWGSVGKWFMAGNETAHYPTVVTNGCYRLKLKSGCENFLPDLVFALSSEFYRIQMRALATGSDGLADISEDSLKSVIIPIIQDGDVRVKIHQTIDAMKSVSDSLSAVASKLLENDFANLNIKPRKSNFSQV